MHAKNKLYIEANFQRNMSKVLHYQSQEESIT